VRLECHPATGARWNDLVALFGSRGACAGCWCMWPRRTRAAFERGKGAGNRRALKRLVDSGAPPGVLAYADGDPVGWCAVAPREACVRLAGSRILAPVDGQPVWSVVCFFIARGFRRRGLSVRLLREAVRFAAARGARVVEGYPFDLRRGPLPDAFVWHGLASTFRKAGFLEVARRSPTRPIMRRVIRPKGGRRGPSRPRTD
jgi:GNAT superfamily N-acetyltransferase